MSGTFLGYWSGPVGQWAENVAVVFGKDQVDTLLIRGG